MFIHIQTRNLDFVFISYISTIFLQGDLSNIWIVQCKDIHSSFFLKEVSKNFIKYYQNGKNYNCPLPFALSKAWFKIIEMFVRISNIYRVVYNVYKCLHNARICLMFINVCARMFDVPRYQVESVLALCVWAPHLGVLWVM